MIILAPLKNGCFDKIRIKLVLKSFFEATISHIEVSTDYKPLN